MLLGERSLHHSLQITQPLLQISLEMYPQETPAALGENIRVNVRAGLGHIDGASSRELIDNCISWLRG